MKKSLSLLLAALLLPMAMGAQLLAPNRLADNQMIIGHYTTDQLATTGWGKTFLNGDNTVATDLTPDELSLAQGSEITAFRVGLFSTTPVTRVFVIPYYADGSFGQETSWACNASDPGWNVIELSTPYLISLPDDAKLRIGFDYVQNGNRDTPLSVVKTGTIYPSYHKKNGNWINYGVNTTGNLSLQIIVENDNFPNYIIKMKNITCKAKVRVGDDVTFSFQTCNLGMHQVAAGGCTYQIAVDGAVVGTMTNPQDLTNQYMTVNGSINTADIPSGGHTLTITAVEANGEALDDPASLSCEFATFDNGYTRQMRLVEELTSHSCTYCPLGASVLHKLEALRGDVALVAVHGNLSSQDPFNNTQCDSIMSFLSGGSVSFPTGAFDRTKGFDSEDPNALLAGLGYYEQYHDQAAQFLSDMFDLLPEDPAFAQVNINSTYDAETRKAVITIDGEMVSGFDDVMGSDSKLTVYITEDHLIDRQLNMGTWETEYEHNSVFRTALGGVRGVALKKSGNTYKNEFTVTIPSTWNADNLNVVAFISRPLLANAFNDLSVNNANKRKLGEFDQPAVIPGDLNGDKILDVADVTLLIDVVLNNLPVDLAIADLTGDNGIDVADVVALIDIVLNGH